MTDQDTPALPCRCADRRDSDDRPMRPDTMTCGHCGFAWCDRCHPTPAARCHNEANHAVDTTPSGPPMAPVVWIVREELETGSQDGETNWLLSAHATMAGAHAAVGEWATDEEHEGHDVTRRDGDGSAHCHDCGLQVDVVGVQIEE